MLANLYILREHHSIRGTASPLWSISLEEQFYLIAPFLMKLGPALVTGFAVLALAGAYICLGFLPHRYLASQSVAWVNSFVQFQFFSAGLLLAALLHKRDFRAPVVARVFLLAVSTALYLLAAGPLGIKDTTPIHTSQLVSGYAAVLVGTVCVFLAFYNLPYRIPRLITYLGSISFGLYVFHSVWIDTAPRPAPAAFRLGRQSKSRCPARPPSHCPFGDALLPLLREAHSPPQEALPGRSHPLSVRE
jgi:peptidoglycan/LPS O-acetylase OafA/YrhL